MKTKILFALISGISAFAFISCNETNSVASTKIEASKTTDIKKGEPVTFKMKGTDANETVEWSVSPATNVDITQQNQSASIVFRSQGKYNVKAISSGENANVQVSVKDSLYTGATTGGSAVKALTGDIITLTPTVIDSMGIKGLAFRAVTKLTYECESNYLITNPEIDGQNLIGSFGGVYTPGSCESTVRVNAVGSLFYYPLTEGTYTLKISINGNTYTGTVVYSNKKFTITWSDTKEIVISPLTVQ